MYDYVVRFKLIWLALETFWPKSFVVNEGPNEHPIRAFHVLDEEQHKVRSEIISITSHDTPCCSYNRIYRRNRRRRTI